jgi:AraC-like DNA-binding protein
MPPGRNLTFFLPHSRVNYDPAAMRAVLRFGGQTPEGRYLANAMRMIFKLSGAAVPDNEAALGHAFCGTVAGLLDRHAVPTGGSANLQTARIEAARRVIDLNLADPEFGPEHVLAKVAASRATLYRDFAPMGGLMAYIKSRRLEMAYHILSMSRPDRGAVSHAAKSAGFASMASFSREFRDLFGSSPSEVLGQWRRDAWDGLQPAGGPTLYQPDSLRALYTWPSATTASGYPLPRKDAQVQV